MNQSLGHSVVVRAGELGDAEAICALGAIAFRLAHQSFLDEPSIDAIIAQTYNVTAVSEAICRCDVADNAFFLVASTQTAVVGYLEYDAFGGEPELHRIYVDPAQKGAGLGTTMLEELHRRLRQPLNYRVVVASPNVAALRFYEHRGFRLEREVADSLYPGVILPEGSTPVTVSILRKTIEERP